MSARWDVPCPTCGAKPNDPCRAITSGRVSDSHAARRNLWHDTRQGNLRSEDGAKPTLRLVHSVPETCYCDDWDVYDGYAECPAHPSGDAR